MYLAGKNLNFEKPNRTLKLLLCTIYPAYWMLYWVDMNGVVQEINVSYF